MYNLMISEMAGRDVSLLTMLTLVRSLSVCIVDSHVPLQVVLPGELLLTEGALVGSLLGVLLHVMSLQVTAGQEPLLAELALVASLPVCVRHHVPLEIAALAELLATPIAAVLVPVPVPAAALSMPLLPMLLLVVLLELFLVNKHHGAFNAGVYLLPVFSHVALQAPKGWEHGGTLLALEGVLLKQVKL